MKKSSIFMILILIFACLAPLAASEVPAPDDIIVSDIPINYGDEAFRARILERTKGERDPIGVVLTGGSARAFAHLGVLKYLEEQGIEPDFIISNSMGSIIGMLYASGLSTDQILSVITSGELSTFFKMTVPIEGGILDPSSFKGLIESIVGKDVQIEELPIPTMVICQDLVTKREVRIMEGDFSDVLIASFALPVYFPPVEYRGHLLIDGGIVNLAPISVAYDYSDTVIVSTTFYDNESLNLKNPLTIVNTAFDIGKRHNAASELREYGDRMIWIRCAVEQFSFMEFSAAEEMSQIGYESAAAVSDQLDQLYKGGLDQRILEGRSGMQAAIDKAISNQYYFGRVEQPDTSQTLSLGIYSFQGDDYPYYLRDSFDIGVEYSWKFRSLELSLLGGGAFDLTRSKNTSAAFLTSATLNWYPVSRVRLSLYGTATFDGTPKWYTPSFYLRQGFDYKIVSGSWYDVEFNEAVELFGQIGNSSANDQLLLSTRLLADFTIPAFEARTRAGYFLQLLRADGELRQFAEGAFDLRVYFIPRMNFFFDTGLMGRFAVDGKKAVPLFSSDGYVTNKDIISSAGSSETQGYLFKVPISLGYAFIKNPTFGELLMFEQLELSAYCDLLFYNGPVPGYSTGVELQFALSLIGLQKVPIKLRVGYDSLDQDVIWSLRFAVRR